MGNINEGRYLCQLLVDAGYEAYIVGGAVRDMLLGIPIGDIDITTNASPEQMRRVLWGTELHIIPVGEKFGTLLITHPTKLSEPIEMTTYRSEGEYSDKRHPDSVKFETDLIKDLERRDFTINAIAMNPFTEELIDPFGGQEDIKNKILRTVGDPDTRFQEDPLRMMRLCRFYAKLDFKINCATYNFCFKNVELLNEIPVQRIMDELMKLLNIPDGKRVVHGLSMMYITGIMKTILPEVTSLVGIKQPPKYHKHDVFTHSILTVAPLPQYPLLRFAGLIHDVGKVIEAEAPPPFAPNHTEIGVLLVEKICKRFRISNSATRYIIFLVKHHMDVYVYKGFQKSKKAVRRYLARIGDDVAFLPSLFTLIKADIQAMGMDRGEWKAEVEEWERFITLVYNEVPPLTRKDLAINGHDLMKLGISASPIMGEIQEILLAEIIDNPELNTREYLLKRVKELQLKGW